MPRSLARPLQAALSARKFVRLTRRFEQGQIRGYVLAIERSHFLLALVDDRVRFAGFECLRIKDLESIEEDPYAAFAEAALKKRGLRRPRMPHLDMSSIRSVVESAGAAFPLVVIHREENDPDVCHIGQVVAVSRTQLALLEIGPDAKWDADATAYALREITRVSFGGDYENALFLVGGPSRW